MSEVQVYEFEDNSENEDILTGTERIKKYVVKALCFKMLD